MTYQSLRWRHGARDARLALMESTVPLVILLKPFFVLAYVGLIAGIIWLVQRLPASRIKRLLLKRW